MRIEVDSDDFVPVASTEIAFTSGWKYRLEKQLFYKFHNSLPFSTEHFGKYYAIFEVGGDWWLTCYSGFGWDGPSGPLVRDRDYLMLPSAVHDVLHWCIEIHGLLPASANDLIDKELRDAIRYGKTPIQWWLGGEMTRELRAKIVERATNTCDGKPGQRKPVRILRI